MELTPPFLASENIQIKCVSSKLSQKVNRVKKSSKKWGLCNPQKVYCAGKRYRWFGKISRSCCNIDNKEL